MHPTGMLTCSSLNSEISVKTFRENSNTKEPLNLPVHTVDAPADTEGDSKESNGANNDDVPVKVKTIIIVIIVVLSSHWVKSAPRLSGRLQQNHYKTRYENIIQN